MSESGPHFYAWCDEADRLDAFAAALSALVTRGGACNVWIWRLGAGRLEYDRVPLEEAVAAVRSAFGAGTHALASFVVTLSSGRFFSFDSSCTDEAYERVSPSGPLHVWYYDRRDLFLPTLEIALGGGARSVEVEAAMLSLQIQDEIEDLMRRLCAPDAAARVTTGGCGYLRCWAAPLEIAATYHADAAQVARDLALSWVHLYDGDVVERAAGLSLSALAARVEAAPPGARVGIAANVDQVSEHLGLDHAATMWGGTRLRRVDIARLGPRPMLPSDAELTREQVLAALATPPAMLLDALEVAAVPDDEWRAMESRALDLIEAKKQGAPTEEVDISGYKVDAKTGKHARFIERHAPYHVRRLPNGGVLLATHPYRTLWPLWADALFLLGIRS